MPQGGLKRNQGRISEALRGRERPEGGITDVRGGLKLAANMHSGGLNMHQGGASKPPEASRMHQGCLKSIQGSLNEASRGP